VRFVIRRGGSPGTTLPGFLRLLAVPIVGAAASVPSVSGCPGCGDDNGDGIGDGSAGDTARSVGDFWGPITGLEPPRPAERPRMVRGLRETRRKKKAVKKVRSNCALKP